MITTGIIREVGISKGSFTGNAYKVELNIFQTPGDNEKENYTYIANCSVAGGLYDSYEVGDKVFVAFLHNNKSSPVILGKIFQGNNTRDESRSFANLNRLKVGNAVELPQNTSIGTTKWQEVLNLFDEIEILKNTTHPESDITVEDNSSGTLISDIKVDGEDKHKLIITKTTPPDITVEVSDPSGTGTIVSNVAVDDTNKHKLIVTKTTPSEVLTPEEREKINAIDLDGDGTKYLADDGEYKFLDLDNDYTTADKDKLEGIESNAQVNIIEEIKVNNVTQTPEGKSVNITIPNVTVQTTGTGVVSDISADKHEINVTKQQLSVSDLSDGEKVATKTYVDTGLDAKVSIEGDEDISGNKNFIGDLYYKGGEVATKQDLSKVFKYKGSVESYANLPTSGNEVGDVWNVLDTGKNYAWSDRSDIEWDDLAGIVDLSDYYDKLEINALVSQKVDNAPEDGKVYGQQYNDWVSLEDTSELRDALCFEGNWGSNSWTPRDIIDGGTI